MFRALDLARARQRDMREIELRHVQVAEREVALLERSAAVPAPVPAPRPEMPSDLHERITRWEEPWAQEAESRTIWELYRASGDWDEVRRQLTPSQLS